MNPPLISIPETINAMLHVINAFVMTMEYTIPLATLKKSDGAILRFCKQLKAIKRIQKDVAFADRIVNVFHMCVLRMELKIVEMEWEWELELRKWIMNDLEMRRNEREKGRTRMEEEMVWESLRLRMEKNSDSGGKPAA